MEPIVGISSSFAGKLAQAASVEKRGYACQSGQRPADNALDLGLNQTFNQSGQMLIEPVLQ